MTSTLPRLLIVSLAAVALGGIGLFAADDAKKATAPAEPAALPAPAEVTALEGYPDQIKLKGGDDTRQIILTAKLADGRLQDLSTDAAFAVAPEGIARVTSGGRVVPLADGNCEITASYGDKNAKIPVRVETMNQSLPINFGNQVIPVFTKLGCNSGGCHGKLAGQNGFRLSLLGFDPELDFTTLVKEDRGRRVFPAAPDHSLLLLKASGAVAHGGGKRMEVGSDEYKLIRRWIAAGTPFGSSDDPVVTKITVYPEHRILTRHNKQQFGVYAHYTDGTIEDVTRRAQYESNDTEVAVVEPTGLVRTLALSGEAAIMARYQGQVAVFRATVPLGARTPDYKFAYQTLVDQYTHKKWQELGIVPSELSSDGEFIRRAALDTTGTLPSPAQVTAFVTEQDSAKRDKLVDALVETGDYSYFFANKWADILRVKRRQQTNRAFGTFAFHDWIRNAIAADKPYDEFVRDILAAIGEESESPPVVWYKELQTPEQFVDDASQVFLGQRLACAQCHHHPYERWSQEDYWGLAAFFGRVGRKNVPMASLNPQNQLPQQLVIFNASSGNVRNKRTGQTAAPKTLDGDPMKLGGDDDPRQKLVDWMVNPKNPFFARAVVNRYWAHFFGRGIVDPLDDMRVTNPPSNPDLLDALAKDFVEHKYSLKHLVKTICKSRTYQLSSIPNDFNKHDKQTYARYYPKRMSAEVLYDAVNLVTDSPTGFNGLPQDRYGPRRAIMLPDESFPSYFLDVFGRPQRISACECERVSEANLAQTLHLLNSEEIQGKLSRSGGRVDTLLKDPRSDSQKVEELFLWALARKPTPEQLKLTLDHIAKNSKEKKAAYENILWALINSKEFLFVR